MLQNYEPYGDGYYFMIGAFDALHGQPARIVPIADIAHQSEYNDGYASGVYMEVRLDQTTM